MLACETGALVANEVVAELGPALVLGQLVDRIVSTYVVVGRVPDDPFASAIESLKAEGSSRTLAWLDAAPPDVIADLRDDLAHRRVPGPRVVASRGPQLVAATGGLERASPSPKGD